MSEEAVVLGKRIKELRRRAGVTQAELAERMGISDSAVSKWEKGGTELSVAIVKEVCSALGCSVVELLGLDPPEITGESTDEVGRRLFEKVSDLPRIDQLRVLGYIEAILDEHTSRRE